MKPSPLSDLIVAPIILLLISNAAILQNPTEQFQEKRPGKWFEGGTLHEATIAEWKKATEENKLATCSDFIAKIKKVTSLEDLKKRSVELKVCITTATKGLPSTDNAKVRDIAVLCAVELGY